jgi:hypothetical protein
LIGDKLGDALDAARSEIQTIRSTVLGSPPDVNGIYPDGMGKALQDAVAAKQSTVDVIQLDSLHIVKVCLS